MVDVIVKPETNLHFTFKGGFRDGQTLVVGGVAGDSRFAINLRTVDALALHINARQDEEEVVLNSQVDGEWGDEERISWPVNPGEEFKISLQAVDGEYKIKVNKGDPHTYKHRVPTDEVLHAQVDGNIDLNKFRIKN